MNTQDSSYELSLAMWTREGSHLDLQHFPVHTFAERAAAAWLKVKYCQNMFSIILGMVLEGVVYG